MDAKSKLNAFVFPTITQFRFVLVCLLLVTTSFDIGKAIYWVYHEDAKAVFLDLILKNHSTTEFELASIAFMQLGAIRLHTGMSLLWGLITFLMLLILTAIFYYAHPDWLIRKHRFQCFDETGFLPVVSCVNALLAKAHLPCTPILVWNPVDPSPTGAQVFGTQRKTYIGLSGGLVATFYRNPKVFSAVFLHELAHIKNKDVGKTYQMAALWLAVLINGIIWVTATFANGLNKPYTISEFYANVVELVFIIGVAFFSYFSFLRSRELYADLRASTWEEEKGGLLNLLQGTSDRLESGWSLLQSHPTSKARCGALKDPDQLLRLSFWDAFSTGVMATFVTFTAFSIGQWIVAQLVFQFQIPTPFAMGLWTATQCGFLLVLFFPLVSSVGIGIWWSTFRRLLRDYVESDASRLGAGTALGVSSVVFVRYFPVLLEYLKHGSSFRFTDHAIMSRNIVLIVICGTLALHVVFSLSFKWVEICASRWLEVNFVNTFPRYALITSLIACSILSAFFVSICGFFALFITAFVVNGPGTFIPASLADQLPYLIALIVGGLLFIIGPLLWLVPLAASFNGRRHSCIGVSSWAFLESTSGEFRLASANSPELGHAVIIGIVAGCIYYIFFIGVLRVHSVNHLFLQLVHFFGISSTQTGATLLMIFPAFAQATAAMIIAWKVKYLNTLLGLFAANVAGCVIITGVYLFDRNAWTSALDAAGLFLPLVGLGTLLSLPCGYLVSRAKNRIGMHRRASSGFGLTYAIKHKSHLP
jgi:Zn-dependent protease with chaperone function